MNAATNLNKDLEKDESKSILLDMVIFDVSNIKRKMIRLFFKLLGIAFKENVFAPSSEISPYSDEFEEAMKRSEEDIKTGRVYKVAAKDFWNDEAWRKSKTWKD